MTAQAKPRHNHASCGIALQRMARCFMVPPKQCFLSSAAVRVLDISSTSTIYNSESLPSVRINYISPPSPTKYYVFSRRSGKILRPSKPSKKCNASATLALRQPSAVLANLASRRGKNILKDSIGKSEGAYHRVEGGQERCDPRYEFPHI